jgi:hypothetical protein
MVDRQGFRRPQCASVVRATRGGGSWAHDYSAIAQSFPVWKFSTQVAEHQAEVSMLQWRRNGRLSGIDTVSRGFSLTLLNTARPARGRSWPKAYRHSPSNPCPPRQIGRGPGVAGSRQRPTLGARLTKTAGGSSSGSEVIVWSPVVGWTVTRSSKFRHAVV